MSKLLGDNLVVRIGTTTTDPVIMCATSCTLNLTQATIEATCKGDPEATGNKWVDSIAGAASWDISTDNLYDNDITLESFDKLAGIIIDDADGIADNEVDIVFEVVGATSPDVTYYSGKAVLTDISLSAPTKEYATYTANFKGKGKLTQVIATP